jgi:predicted transcriptional regulator of viral defense system
MGTKVQQRELPELFTYSTARRRGLSDRRLRTLEQNGEIEKISRGLFATPGITLDTNLAEIALRAPRSTLCLTSALAHHGLIDEIPVTIDIALPRGTRTPQSAAPITWHRFNLETFDLGRTTTPIGTDLTIGLYTAERSLCDAFRLRHLIGYELANEALKRWLRMKGSQPSELLAIATKLGPKATSPLIQTLQILL